MRRIGVYMGAVALGVAALTGLHAFQEDAAEAARLEARSLLGGDLRIQGPTELTAEIEAALDSLAATGARVTRVVSLASMVSVPAAARSRFLQVNAVDGAFPVVGDPVTDPQAGWERFREGGALVADESVLRQLGVAAGDTVRVGQAHLVVAGAVRGLPVDLGVQAVVGPPVFIHAADLPGTGLLGFGSLAQYRAFVALPEGEAPRGLFRSLRRSLRGSGASLRTARAEAEDLAEGFRMLGRFLGLVGLVALLLGGIGVAGAVHVYVRDRVPSIAVLRCLGAREGTAFRAYLLQAVLLGGGGALVGVVLGILLQRAIPLLLAGLLPFAVEPRIRPVTVLAGLAVGTWTAFLFALFPLLRVREIPPLAALRVDVESGVVRRRLPRIVAAIGLGGTLVLLCVAQTGSWRAGLAFAGALSVVLLVLGATALGLAHVARRLLPDRAPFAVRQGIAGLFRPGNQTLTVLTALGFGTFLMGSILVVAAGLRASLRLDPSTERPALVLFDIQDDQRGDVEAILRDAGVSTDLVPIVPARILSAAGVTAEERIAERGAGAWAYRRVYRNTWRAATTGTERVTAGRWWDGDGEDEAIVIEAVAAGAARISLEEDLAAELQVGVGDVIEWDVQGRPVSTVVASLRSVEWASFAPNFFAVFEPGSLDGAPSTWVALVPLTDGPTRDAIQEALVRTAPNVSFIDVSAVLETLERFSQRILQVLAALAGFATAGGFLVLVATLLTGRFARRRESALLKTLGARARAVRGVLLVEYAMLGGVGGLAGLLLGAGGGIALLRWVFGVDLVVPWTGLAAVWAGIAALTVVAGWSVSGPVVREPPLVVLREAER